MPPVAVRSLGILFLVIAAVGCGDAGARAPSGEPTWFTSLGRWGGDLELCYRVQEEPNGEALAKAVGEAAALWTETGVLRLRPASGGEPAHLEFSFAVGAHGSCLPFGEGDQLAHAGPREPPSFVHFDAERAWNELGAPDGYSLVRAAAHEIGHVLGIGHGNDEKALMFPVPAAGIPRLQPEDLAALHSLYGGKRAGPGDVVIASNGEESVLYGVAPGACTDLAVVDTDGDGDAEVLVWRTDEKGYGALMIYHFEVGPRLVRTVGPIPGVALPGAPHITGTSSDGERLFVSLLADGGYLCRAFDEEGLPRPRGRGRRLVLGDREDEDGDGFWNVPSMGERPTSQSWAGDLDGDGVVEALDRR